MSNFFKLMERTIPLVQLENIEKVVLTDEVETHVLSVLNHEIHHGDSVHKEGLA